MLFSSWLRNWKRSLERRSALRRTLGGGRPRHASPFQRRTRQFTVLSLEQLETRLAPAILTVNTTADNTTDTSVLTLRDAITLVNNGGNPASLGQSSMPAGWASQINTASPFGTNDTIDFALQWNDPGHLYYQSSMGNAQPVPTLAIDGTTPITSDAQLTDPSLVGTGNTVAPQWQNSWWRIQLESDLPDIKNPVVIDGYSQTGASWNTLANDDNAVLRIELNGRGQSLGAAGWGLNIYAGNSTVRGLDINGFLNGNGIILHPASGDRVQGNFIGTDVSGTLAPYGLPNFSTFGTSTSDMANGITLVESSGFQHDYIGTDSGTDPTDPPGWSDLAERNIISACGQGMHIIGSDFPDANQYSAAQTNNVIAGNFIGTDIHGTTALGNWAGLAFEGGTHDDLVGTNGDGTNDTGERNVISGNEVGVVLNGAGSPKNFGSYRCVLAGNWIGIGANGDPMGTLGAGVAVDQGALAVRIGGPSAVLGNTIAYSGNSTPSLQYDLASNGTPYPHAPGVWILTVGGETPLDITVQGNSIYGNAGLGIDLGGSYPPPATDGVTLNDSAGHVGPNNFQNFPVLNSAVSSSSDTSITGTFNSGTVNGLPFEPNTTITLDFYANSDEDPSGHGQGKTYLGSTTVTTDANGNATFAADLSVGNLAGQWITATATVTDPNSSYNGDTSEFALDEQATGTPSQTFSQYLQSALPTTQNPNAPTAISIQAGPDLTEDTVISAVNGLTAPSVPVTITLNLNGGTYNDTTVNPPANVTLIIDGSNGTNTFVGHSPAFTITGGNVIVRNVTFTTATYAPTILVTGGSLTLRNDVVQESTGYTDAAISITGGTLDLGTASDPGGNTLNVNGSGEFVHNTTANLISAVGDTFSANGTAQTASTLSFTSLAASAAAVLLNQPVTFTATVRPDGAGTPSGSVDFVDTTTNTDLGSVALSGGTATLTTTALSAGNHVIQATYSGDGTFLSSLDSIAVGVHYTFSGFLPPLSNGLSFAVNRTIPIKFQLTDANGKAVTSLSAVTSLQVLNSTGVDVLAGAGATGLRYDSTSNQFVFNWQTKGLAAGSYQVVLTLADGTTHTATIKLTAGGSSAGLVTDGSVGTATAGALLGGEVDLYVGNSNGELTSDELARINDAVSSIDATIAPYGVSIIEVSDPTQANVTLSMNTTSSLGGLAQGVLGCTTDADQVTMIQGWNWYAGSDPTQVGSGQYDFETAVMHELGHVLGLGHSSDSTSVMYATLAPGTGNRTLVTADLNVPDDGGPCALHAVPVAAVSNPSNGHSMNAPSSTSVPASGNPLSAADQILPDLNLLLGAVRNAYQKDLSSVAAMWQSIDALALQWLDNLLNMEGGAMGLSKDTPIRDLLFASLYPANRV